MLQSIRERATGWIAYTIIGLIVVTFALWGISSYFSSSGPLEVAEVGDSTISLQEFQQAFQQQRQQFPQVDANLLKNMVLQQLVNERVLLQAAKEQGLRIGDQQLQQAILSLPAFQEDGGFNAERYKRLLRAQGYTEIAFEENLRNSLMISQWRNGLVTSALVTPEELDRFISLLNQQRELAYFVLSLNDYLKKVSIEESAIETYYQEHKDRFVNPEKLKIQYLELKLDNIAKDIPVNEDELRTAYQEQIAKYTQPEARSASHILVTLPAEASDAEVNKARRRAQGLYEAVTSGAKTFDQALQEAQNAKDIEGGELGVISKGFYEDPAFEAALYTLKAVGDISEPVRTRFGFHLIRLDDITSESVKSFAEVRDELVQQLRLRKAENRFYDMSENLANWIYEQPDSLEPAAEALGLAIQESDWFDRTGGKGIAAYPEVVTAAFSEEVLKRGFNSEPIELEPNHIVVVRLQDHQQATPQSLEEARKTIIDELRSRQAQEMLAKNIEASQKRARQGEKPQRLADEYDGKLEKPGLVKRSAEKVDNAILNEAFQLPKPKEGDISVGAAVLSNGDQAVVVISRVVPGKSTELSAEERETLVQQLSGQIGASEFESFLDSLRRQIHVATYNDRI
jgi:peptidyl-prolyl cis-trans isomerase D